MDTTGRRTHPTCRWAGTTGCRSDTTSCHSGTSGHRGLRQAAVRIRRPVAEISERNLRRELHDAVVRRADRLAEVRLRDEEVAGHVVGVEGRALGVDVVAVEEVEGFG